MSDKEKIYLIQCLLEDVRGNWAEKVRKRIKLAENVAWNNGYHSCGGKWEYVQPVGHAYSTYFLYECSQCGETKEFSKKR